jgi:peptidoglycan/xylan/chitin deacetylase (PgdA/CDA1 family)
LLDPGKGGGSRLPERAASPAVGSARRRPVAPAEASAAPPAGWRPDYPLLLHARGGEDPETPRARAFPGRELLFTFDDGPDLAGTPLVLEALDRYGIKGIFFVNGRHFSGRRPQDLARRDLVRKLAAHGHLVANHTLTHQNPCARPELVEAEIDGNAELIAAATGVRPTLFRAPYGARCRHLDQVLAARDLIPVGWNLDPQEWRGDDEDAVVAYVTGALRRLRGRATLLLHDTHPGAVRALPRILAWLARENARLVREGRTKQGGGEGVDGPIRVRDYAAFLPPKTLPSTGFEPLVAPLAEPFGTLRAFGLGAGLGRLAIGD